ncbi:hypothetical protein CA264_03750 [Pontibacter actiniarum]|uniref:Uncharacterized protein n=2 Tax=Pontibacter actiniarum TaxID=323450 RepID=A0A1X9YP55_9BACT|nr:hypothetical protein CA264_03750 [Pontibacter actiniarum]
MLSACSTDEVKGSELELSPKETPTPSPAIITHYNFIITPDLSNRLGSHKPVSDTRIVNSLLQDILPNVLVDKRKTNQKDTYGVSFISKAAINQYSANVEDLKIDFNRFKKQVDRIDYVKGRSSGATLSGDQQKFVSEFDRILKVASKAPDGADLWTYFDQGIDNNTVNTKVDSFEYGGKHFSHSFRNIMILLTDGYIEAGMYGKQACVSGNQCYYLSSQRIKSFREAYKKSGESDMKLFFSKNNYGIIPAKNPNLKSLEILVLQMEDRSLNQAGSATQHPTDMEIMKLFWSDWLEKSGVKRFDLRPVLASEDDTKKVIKEFIGA